MSLFSTLDTFTRPRGMNNLQFKDFLSDMESQYGVFSAINKLIGQVRVTNWMISENEGETFSSPSWSRLNVWLCVLHRHQSTHEGTATRSASPCQSHIEQRAATNWKFWLWELYTTVIKLYDKHPISDHEDPTDADNEKETEKEERLQQRWK